MPASELWHCGVRCAPETRLLRVPLRAQPTDAALAVHPLVDFCFAFEAREVNRLDTRKLSQDIPVVLGDSHRFKTYFCFGHAPLWQRLEPQSKVPKVSQVAIREFRFTISPFSLSIWPTVDTCHPSQPNRRLPPEPF